MPELYLCRFSSSGGQAHLGLVANQQLYDLTATCRPEYSGMAAWLQATAGRSTEAIAALEKIPSVAQPVLPPRLSWTQGDLPSFMCPLDQQKWWLAG